MSSSQEDNVKDVAYSEGSEETDRNKESILSVNRQSLQQNNFDVNQFKQVGNKYEEGEQ